MRTRPQDTIPFQCSFHVVPNDGTQLTTETRPHDKYVHAGNGNPRLEIARRLLKDIGAAGYRYRGLSKRNSRLSEGSAPKSFERVPVATSLGLPKRGLFASASDPESLLLRFRIYCPAGCPAYFQVDASSLIDVASPRSFATGRSYWRAVLVHCNRNIVVCRPR